MNALLRRIDTIAFLIGTGLILSSSLPGTMVARAETTQDLAALHAAEQQHRSPAELGAMWAHLAGEYHVAFNFPKAEDAYNRALRLLKDVPEKKVLYAMTLDDLATLYLEFGHLDEAESVRNEGLAIRRKLGNVADIGVSEVHVADIAIARRDFKKAEQFATKGLADMSASASPPVVGTLSALITIAYARCLRGHAGDAYTSAVRALDFANTHFEPDSPAIGFSLQALGYVQWKSGQAELGGKTMQRGLAILRSTLVASDPRLTGALMQYEQYLVTTRQQPEADEIRDEVARIKMHEGTACPSCTVSVYSLAKGLR